MKNPFLLAVFWLICFILEISFSWNFWGYNFRPLLSYFILGYSFFILPSLVSFAFAAVAFIIISSYTTTTYIPFLSVFSLYFFIFWIHRKTLVDNLFAKAGIGFVIVLLNFYLAQVMYGISFSLKSFTLVKGVFFSLYWALNLLMSLISFWILEVKGTEWEERILSFRLKRDLSGFSKIKSSKEHRSLRFSSTRSTKRRLILKDSW